MPQTNLEKRLDKIEADERNIQKQEKEILELDQHILEELANNKKNSKLTAKLYRFRFLVSLLLTIGIVLIWKAIGQLSDEVPILSSALGALCVGIIILLFIDYVTKTKRD